MKRKIGFALIGLAILLLVVHLITMGSALGADVPTLILLSVVSAILGVFFIRKA